MNRIKLHDSLQNNAVFSFARSGGKGGQNVNKVNTKVFLTVNVDCIGGLTEEEKEMLKQKLASSINAEGFLYISVEDERSQEMNRKIALERLEEKILVSVRIPKKRKATRPTFSSMLRNKKAKTIRSRIKQSRSKASLRDEL